MAPKVCFLHSRLALGTAQFGLEYGISNKRGQVPEYEVRTILEEAGNAGIDTIDTAISYGESEKILGRAGVEKWHVITKLPALPDDYINVDAWVSEELKGSLSRLGVSRVRGLLLHRPEQLLSSRGGAIFTAIERLKAEGQVEKVGISLYDVNTLGQILATYSVDIVQVPLNVFDRRWVTSGWLSRLCNRGIEVHTRSAFLQGLLLMAPGSRPARFRPWQTLLNRWDNWLQESNISALQACLSFVLSHEEISRAIIGVTSIYELRELVTTIQNPLVEIPPYLAINDPELINPSRWL